MSLIIDVISRKTSVKQTLINPGDVTAGSTVSKSSTA